MSIAAKNILARKDDALVGNTNVDRKADDAREGHRGRNRVKHQAVGGCDQLSFPEVEEDNGFFDVANTERLVIVIEDEHFAIQFPLRHYGLSMRTEDEHTSLIKPKPVTMTLED